MSVSAIIPALNEENTITGVLDALKQVPGVDEIIVVSDGSTDRTALKARKSGVKVIELPENMGKGAAIKKGLEKCSGDIILLLDADLIGLTVTHVEKLLHPILTGEIDMSVGIFSNGRLATDLAQKISPYLSGQRAVRKSILSQLSDIEVAGYGIEIALTLYGEKENIRMKEVILEDLTHVMKEEKFGILRGFVKRMIMYWQIYKGFRFARR